MLDINSIIIPASRQRKTGKDVDAQFVASVGQRLINPITLRRSDDGPILVTGERRLIGLKAFGLTTLEHNIHYRFHEDLDFEEAEIIELEENVKREDLDWRDHVSAIARIHTLLKKRSLFDNAIAQRLNIDTGSLSRFLFVFRNLESSNLKDASGCRQAYSILQGISERRTVSIVQDLAKAGAGLFDKEKELSNDSSGAHDLDNWSRESSRLDLVETDSARPHEFKFNILDDSRSRPDSTRDILPVLNEDFIKWAASYLGDKFTLIHCDFPYNVQYDSYARSISSVTDDYDFSGFWPLMDALCENIDRLMSYSAHLMFWFSMKFYQPTRERLEKAGLYVHDHPFIWHKTDNSGIIPGRDGLFPRRIYETAFLASRGRRPLIKSLANCYGAPMQTNAIHPSAKPIPVLNHFFSMLVDETTDVLDPTAGSGNALISAEALGARRVVGLELNPTYAQAANAAQASARTLRRITQ